MTNCLRSCGKSCLMPVAHAARFSTSPAVAMNSFGSRSAPHMSAASTAKARKRALDRDFIVSVLELSTTKRDTKGYLQKYASKKSPKSLAEAPKFVQGEQGPQLAQDDSEPQHVAIMKLRPIPDLDTETLQGIAKTLSQLRTLGLLSVVVVDCGPEADRSSFYDESFRLCEAIDIFGKPGAKLARSLFSRRGPENGSSSFLTGNMRVEDPGFLHRCLQHGMIPVVPSLIAQDDISPAQPVDSNDIVLALIMYFGGLQFESPSNHLSELSRPKKIASIERIIILDPLGGTPMNGRFGASHRFINLEQEYDTLTKHLKGPEGLPLADGGDSKETATTHVANLRLARDALSLLPPTASALITTPWAAANTTTGLFKGSMNSFKSPTLGFSNMVTTRRKKNPLLHNLLTDKPVYSSSLPIQRIQSNVREFPIIESSTSATLLKRGMPLTIFPDPRENAWRPPGPGEPRLRLTDNCIDLPRLVQLIEDSFDRPLDVQDYLDRVNENLAGVIVAGEYEGGAILTWEKPFNMDDHTAYAEKRYVPYLDKFAVLKRSQGSGGVADIVFNAMVRDCFPNGVCWRSRKNNPVNKWYFERSAGTNKLPDSNWTLFWTTGGLDMNHPTLKDYESVCRQVAPSWADNKHILD